MSTITLQPSLEPGAVKAPVPALFPLPCPVWHFKLCCLVSSHLQKEACHLLSKTSCPVGIIAQDLLSLPRVQAVTYFWTLLGTCLSFYRLWGDLFPATFPRMTPLRGKGGFPCAFLRPRPTMLHASQSEPVNQV